MFRGLVRNVRTWRKYLDEFSRQKNNKNNRDKTRFVQHLGGLRCWSSNHRARITNEMSSLNFWWRHQGSLKIQFQNFRQFGCGIVGFNVFLLRFCLFQTSLYASLDFVNNIFFKCWGKIKYSKITMFFSELSFVVEKYVKYFPFSGITELTKREKELSNSTSSSAKLSMRFRHAWGSAVFFQTSGYVDV